MRVLVTRAEPAASNTAKHLISAGHAVIKLPLFEIRDTGKEIPQGDFDGYVFTSGNACAVLEQRGWQPKDLGKPVFCVGEKTAEKAKSLGFQNVIFAQGGALKLAPKIISAELPNNPKLSYFTTPDRSFDLRKHLAPHQISVTNFEIYKAEIANVSPKEIQNQFKQAKPDAILTYSKRSSDALADLLSRAGLSAELPAIKLIAISNVAIGNLNAFQWNEIAFPPVANEQAMLHILDK